jgi:hypothetical protein
MGKFKNKKTLVKNIGKDEYNMPTINGKKAATFRMTEDEIRSTNTNDITLDFNRQYQQKININMPGNGKPKGMWYGIDNSWTNHCTREAFLPKIKKYNFIIDLDVSSIFVLDSIEKYQYIIDNYGFLGRWGDGLIDWAKLSANYKGIEIPNYDSLRNKIPDDSYDNNNWISSWDVNSGCIWDLTAIKDYRSVECEDYGKDADGYVGLEEEVEGYNNDEIYRKYATDEQYITKVRQGIIPYEGGVMGEANIGTEMKRAFIDWDSNYGKCFKVVSTPKGAESGGNWDKDLISIVTPENGDAWGRWTEVPFNILNNWKSNWKNIQKSLADYKYNQILRCLQKMNEVLEKDVDLNSFEVKKELNPKIWVDKKLNYKVRKRLLKIADDFLDFINVDSKYCKDVLLLGSLANYNWSKYSDIDLHLVVDFKKINSDVELIKEYFDTKRKLWALEHESLKIYGFPVELYIQDVDETNFSTGEFSLEKNKWTKIPKEDQEDLIDVNKIKQKSADIMTVIEDLKSKYDKKKSISDIEDISKKVKSMFDNIKKLRKSGLESKLGEFSVGNIVFKVLRRSGHMETLVDLKRSTYDKINTIK